MTTTMIDRPVHGTGITDLDRLGAQRYVRVTTFRRSGEPGAPR